jgi:hypothetical protein
MKLMLIGDTHGGIDNITPKLDIAKTMGIQHVVQVGDFGLWPGMEGQVFLDEVQASAKKNGLSVYAIPGNHEQHDWWEMFVNSSMPTHKGFTAIRSRILIAPKVNNWRWAGKQFISAGGAVSIDKANRLFWETRTGPRTAWWPNEQLTDADVDKLKAWDLRADYLITHDCSNYTPFGFDIDGNFDSQIHRRRIDEVISLTKPALHFHGHMHAKYDWVNEVSHGYGYSTQTYGLEHDKGWNSFGVLDTETDEFHWRGVE